MQRADVTHVLLPQHPEGLACGVFLPLHCSKGRPVSIIIASSSVLAWVPSEKGKLWLKLKEVVLVFVRFHRA